METIRQMPQILQSAMGIFGPVGTWEHEEFCKEKLLALLTAIKPEEASTWGFEWNNNVFAIYPYWWGDCTCHFNKLESLFLSRHPHNPGCYFQLKRQYMVESEMLSYCDCHVADEYYDWLEKSGAEHSESCRLVCPNFRCGDISIRWYKTIGRGMSCDTEITRQELEAMFNRCFESLQT